MSDRLLRSVADLTLIGQAGWAVGHCKIVRLGRCGAHDRVVR